SCHPGAPPADSAADRPCDRARHAREDRRRITAQEVAALNVRLLPSSVASATRRSLCFSLGNNARAYLMSRSPPLSAAAFGASVEIKQAVTATLTGTKMGNVLSVPKTTPALRFQRWYYGRPTQPIPALHGRPGN